ncbi:uncharacterized protein LOC130713312 [Lotus japonicus]|uniref:uncharacterized protein LOC130713312 n=1 Tax=Lotus japonicus TaxID=34305 RepID=UPI002583FFE8|nr:uncharacterized protein LOC130713312 [Lotus japonicus]
MEDRIIGGGSVIRDHRGRCLVGCYSRENDNNAFKAEALASPDVLQLAWDRGFRKVICDVDCIDLVKVITDAEAVHRHSEYLVLSSICQLLAKQWDVKLNSFHRDSNVVADYLARRGANEIFPGFWIFDSLDPDIEYLLLKNLMSIL